MDKLAFHRVGVLLALADVGLVKYASVVGTLLRAGAAVARNRAKDEFRELVGFETPEWRQKQKELIHKSLESAKDYAGKIKDYVLPEEEEAAEEIPTEPEPPVGMFTPAEEKAPTLGEVAAPTHESLV